MLNMWCVRNEMKKKKNRVCVTPGKLGRHSLVLEFRHTNT